VTRHPIGRRRAALWGAVLSRAIAAADAATGRLLGWLQSMDPKSSGQLGGGKLIASLDGILTPYGWRMLAQDAAVFILVGVAIALIVRAIIEPERQ
jgi:hypothetical protein